MSLHFASMNYISTFPILRHLLRLFLGLPAEWFYYQTSSQNRYNPTYSPPPLPPQKKKEEKPRCGDKLQNIAVEAEQAEWPQGQPAVLCWQLSLSPVVERPACPYHSLIILQLELGNPPYYRENPSLSSVFVTHLLKQCKKRKEEDLDKPRK